MAGDIRGDVAHGRASVVGGAGSSAAYHGVQSYGFPAHNITPDRHMQDAEIYLDGRAAGLVENDIESAIRKEGLR